MKWIKPCLSPPRRWSAVSFNYKLIYDVTSIATTAGSLSYHSGSNVFKEEKEARDLIRFHACITLSALISVSLSEKSRRQLLYFRRKISDDAVVKGALTPDGLKRTTISSESTFPRRIFKPKVQLQSCLILKIKELRRISFESVNR